MIKKDECCLNFGKQIRFLREQKELSQEDFAEVVGIHRTYIGGIERGERNPTLTTIYKLAKALDVEPCQILK